MNTNILSYYNILEDIKRYKRAGTAYGSVGDDFNKFDTPSYKYFKILFYFGSTPEFFDSDSGSGLLAPTWLNNISSDDYYNYNSAWAFLKMNNEEERAEKLEHFITLLSNINTYSPWYFQTVGGITEALERKVTEDGKLDLNEPKKLTIGCLGDAFDNRITTLLELYRDITWSWPMKREIIPSNLRKFDMAIYIFETPTDYMHNEADVLGSDNGYKISYKMIEFHDCEFNYNSLKSGWGELSNAEGFNPKYTIDISYNDCYEISYNDIMMRKIGDVILTDLLNSSSDSDYISHPQKDDTTNSILFDYRSNRNSFGDGFLMTAAKQVVGHFVKDVKSLFTKAILGNLHTFSLTQLGTQLSEASKGNLIKAGLTAAQYVKTIKNNNNEVEAPNGNIYPKRETIKQKPTGDIYPTIDTTKQKPTGDIYPNIKTIKQKPIGNIFSEKKKKHLEYT